jgi:uncharacterized oxidoreductase
MARVIGYQAMVRTGTTLFEAAGAPRAAALVTADQLATSSLMGCDSHGVLRIPEYLQGIAEGAIVPGAEPVVEPRSEATAVVDCGHGLGAVGAARAVEAGIELARRHQVACVITRRCHHVGRLGACPERAARAGLVALATCNSPVHGHFVLPWGGKLPRLATNPIAYAVPTGGEPVLADFSTSVAPEGKIRWFRNSGLPLPPGWILDADGRPSTDPNAFYGPPRGGILPLGGPAGYKGFALGLLVEVLGSALAGLASTDETVVGNGVCLVLIDPTCFVPLDRFKTLMDDLVAYVKASPPIDGVEEVLVPGELEFRTRARRLEHGIPIDDVTWDALCAHADRLGVDLEGEAKKDFSTDDTDERI